MHLGEKRKKEKKDLFDSKFYSLTLSYLSKFSSLLFSESKATLCVRVRACKASPKYNIICPVILAYTIYYIYNPLPPLPYSSFHRPCSLSPPLSPFFSFLIFASIHPFTIPTSLWPLSPDSKIPNSPCTRDKASIPITPR